MKDEYPDTKSDLFAGFIERCTTLAGPQGMVAMITMQSWMFLSSYEKLRAALLTKQRITSMLHLGARAFDSIGGEVVSSTAFVQANVPPEARNSARKRAGTFVRLVDGASEAEKMTALGVALLVRTKSAGFYLASDVDFAAIPGSPIVYWLSEKMRAAFAWHPSLGASYDAMNGMTTGENAAFLRLWHEVSGARTCRLARSAQDSVASGARWFPYNKGGEFRKWYGNQEHVINWECDGRDVIDNGRAFPRGRKFYFRPMVSWAKVSSGQPAFRFYPGGFLFDVAGTAMFGRSLQALADAIALCNSSTAEAMLAALSPTMNFESGQIARLPLAGAEGASTGLCVRVDELISSSKRDWDESETSWDFAANPLVALVTGR